MRLVSVLHLFFLFGCIFCEQECSSLCESGVCCDGPNGNTLCCPVHNGICCASGSSCCPSGTQCEEDGFCTRIDSGFFAFMNYITPSPPQSQVTTHRPISHPVAQTHSTSNSCPTVCGDLCCPFQQGVCCADGSHCCPNGYECDAGTRSCHLSPKPAPTLESFGNRSCQNDESGCQSTDTCCIMNDGSKGCCPFEKADCCADGLHCCPSGTRCTAHSDGCEPKTGPWVNPFLNPQLRRRQLLRSQPSAADAGVVRCPDGKSACVAETTCCQSTNGSFACCPLSNGVCCGDGAHCCPQGYTCDMSGAAWGGDVCVLVTVPAASAPASPAPASAPQQPFMSAGYNSSRCKDGRTICSEDMTCCQLANDSSACCPLPNAVCCEDHEHCCPQGYRCDVNLKSCVQVSGGGAAFLPITPKVATAPPLPRFCQYGHTECSTVAGDRLCCPLGNAVCCEDGKHCCPAGTECVAATGQCIQRETATAPPGTLMRAPRLLNGTAY